MPTKTLALRNLCVVYCDIANSTALLAEARRAGNESAYVDRITRHLDLWAECFKKWGATCCKFRGDGWLVTFDTAIAAVQGLAEAWDIGTDADKGEFRMRASVHWGEVSVRADSEPLGTNANLGNRVLGAAFCDQMLLTEACADLLRPELPADWELHPAGRRLARGLSQPLTLYSLRSPAMPQPTRRAKGILPDSPNQFVGREAEKQALERSIVEDGQRLITLLGTGGSGKTRLAIETGRTVADDFPDGVFFIPLEDALTMESVFARIAATFEVRLASAADPLYVLKAHLENCECLLILDNFEQVEEPALPLLELRDACPKLSLIVTSREPLDLYGEVQFDVAPLHVPDENARFEEIRAADSVTLFVQRVKAVKWEFALTEANAPEVATLCRTLGGLPLAIELVAGQMRRYSISNLLTLSSELLDIQSRLHGLSPRQKSLRAAFDWTYRGMTEPEQSLFDSLGIFETSFTLDDVEAVCDLSDAFDSLDRLREKSLVTPSEEDGTITYRLLMPVREYARHHLGDPKNPLRQNYIRWYTRRAQNCYEQSFAQNNEREALRRVRADLENFRSAWNMALADRANDLLGVLGMSVTSFAPLLPRSADIAGWIPKVEEILTAQSDMRRLCRLFNTMGRMATVRGDFEQAVAYQRRVLEYFTETASFPELADAQSTLALFAHRAEMWDDAERFAQDALMTAELSLNRKAAGLAMCVLANLRLPHFPAEAKWLGQAGLEAFDEIGDRVGKMHASLALARTATAETDLQTAENYYRAALKECLIMESLLYMARCGEFVGQFYLEQGCGQIAVPLLFSVAEAQRLQGMPLSAQKRIEGEDLRGKPMPLSQAVRELLDAPDLFAL